MRFVMVMLTAACLAVPAFALEYDQNVTPDVIFGDGNANGAFTVDVQSYETYSIELGLRGKLRFNAANQPENTFNSNGSGGYLFMPGAAPGGFSWNPNSPTTPVWNFEFTVNVDQTSLGNKTLDDFTYELGLDFDPDATGTTYLPFDPITPSVTAPFFDHAIGDNLGTIVSATDPVTYANYLAAYNVAQNSWNYEFFNDPPFDTFDPDDLGTYQIYLKAFDNGVEVAHTAISIIINDDTVATEETTWSQVKSLYQ